MGLNPAGVTNLMKEFFRNTKPFGQLITLFVLVVLFFILAAGVTAGAVLFGLDYGNVHHMLLLQIVTQLIAFLVPALVVAYLFSDTVSGSLRFDFSKRKWLLAAVGVFVLLLMVPFTDWLSQVNDSWHWSGRWAALEEQLRDGTQRNQDLVEEMLSLPGVGNLLFNLLAIALVPAICEEFLFRGGVQTILGRWVRNPHLAVLLSAAIFSLMHGEFFVFLPRFFLGVLLGYLFYYGGSMLVNVAAHFVNNAIVVVAWYLYANGTIGDTYVENIDAPMAVWLVGLILGSALFYMIFIRSKNTISPPETTQVESSKLPE